MKSSKNLSKQLKAYALTAGCFLTLHQEANAEVVYTDIEPDIILDGPLQNATVDMDNNAVSDVFFHNNSFQFYDDSWLTYKIMQNILVGPEVSDNALEGIINSFNTGYNTFTRYYPFALDNFELISELKTWQNHETQVMALRILSLGGTTVGFGFACYWYSLYAPESIDKYIGVKFKGDDELNHFGWIRCDVLNEGRRLIIKDYAYETEPEYPILAGDTIQYVDVKTTTNLDATIYSFGNTIHINVNEQNQNTQISIYDLSGKLMHTQKMQEKSTSIILNKPSGMYTIKIISENKSYTKNVFIQPQ